MVGLLCMYTRLVMLASLIVIKLNKQWQEMFFKSLIANNTISHLIHNIFLWFQKVNCYITDFPAQREYPYILCPTPRLHIPLTAGLFLLIAPD